jgi:molybdopterin converting factor subunit 1
MKVRVVLFAMAREAVGSTDLEVELPPGACVKDLRRVLIDRHPTVEAILDRSMIAVDEEYADDSDALADRSEVAVIPPVSGG